MTASKSLKLTNKAVTRIANHLRTPTEKVSADYKGKDDPYTKEVVNRQDDGMRMEDDETNLENWKELGGGKTKDYKRGQAIDPLDQMFDYTQGMLHAMREAHAENPDGARDQEYAAALEQVMNLLDPFI